MTQWLSLALTQCLSPEKCDSVLKQCDSLCHHDTDTWYRGTDSSVWRATLRVPYLVLMQGFEFLLTALTTKLPSHTHTDTQALCLSLIHTHTDTEALCLTHTQALSLTHAHSHTDTQALCLSLTHTHTETQKLSVSHPHASSLSLPHKWRCECRRLLMHCLVISTTCLFCYVHFVPSSDCSSYGL